MKTLTIFLCTVLLVACSKQESLTPSADIKVIGHGGTGFEAYTNPWPANSMVSIRRAMEGLGADGVEVDIQLSADQVIVAYHDQYLESKTSCTGCIPSQTWEELKACTYKKDGGMAFSEVHQLVTLEEILEVFSRYQPHGELYLDVRLENKCGQAPDQITFVDGIIGLIEKYNATSWVVVESPSADFLRLVRERSDGLRLMLDASDPDKFMQEAKDLGIEGFVSGNDDIQPEAIERLKALDMKLVLFNVRDQSSLKRALEKQPYAVQADNLELMQEYLR